MTYTLFAKLRDGKRTHSLSLSLSLSLPAQKIRTAARATECVLKSSVPDKILAKLDDLYFICLSLLVLWCNCE